MRLGNVFTVLCSVVLVGFCTSIKLQASKKDAKFWNVERILLDEPKGQWPDDALKCLYVDDWSYWYRKNGMQTSTDDVIVAFVAAYPEITALSTSGCMSPDLSSLKYTDTKATDSTVNRYVDLGCGIGSTLLLVANILRPKSFSLGVEAQEQSARLLQRTLSELPDGSPSISVIHKDLRDLLKSEEDNDALVELDQTNDLDKVEGYCSISARESESGDRNWDHISGSCDLITANPPYAPLQSGTLCKDEQRRSARFELRGGVEEYLLTVKHLLSTEGRFILAFWSRDDERVRGAVEAAGLRIHRRFDVIMGEPGRTLPHLSVYDIRSPTRTVTSTLTDSCTEMESDQECEILKLDITRDPLTGGMNKNYELIRHLLKCAARPLKRK